MIQQASATVRNIIVMGSSAGGPPTLLRLFEGLPAIRAAVILVQHMPAFISESFRATLQRAARLRAKIAEDGEQIAHGTVYVTPGDQHLELLGNRVISLHQGEKVNFVRPAVDVTLHSLTRRATDRVIGVILTGMGKDGAAGITYAKQNLGATIIAQDEQSSIVYGMPMQAARTGHVDYVLNPEQIRDKLVELVGVMN